MTVLEEAEQVIEDFYNEVKACVRAASTHPTRLVVPKERRLSVERATAKVEELRGTRPPRTGSASIFGLKMVDGPELRVE